MRKCRVNKMWFMALLLVVFVAGCGREQGILQPTLTSISPNRSVQGQAVGVTLTGTSFATGATVNVSGTLVTVSNTAVVSSTQITATFTIAANATLGDRNVTVTTSGATTTAVTFTIAPPLTVSSTSPTNGATGVPIDQPLTATFGEALNCTTVTTSTFTVTGPGGTPVTGTILCAGTSATFTPTSLLASNTAYTATLTTGITDSEGDPLASNFVWRFTTGASSGATAPTVTFTSPANNASGVPINRKITATFSQAMVPSTITTSTFTVTGPAATPVAGAITYDTINNIATFAPASNLASNTLFTATITTRVTNLSGTAMANNFVWSFTTGATPDTTAPTVIFTNPANAATGVPVSQKIAATFSEAMDSSTITTTTFTLAQGTTPISGAVTYAAAGTTATFTPSSNLAANATYTATITTGVRDLAGNALASNFVWSFTTGSALDTTPPTVVSTDPANNATGVCINKAINATFSEAMDPATINTATFTVAGPASAPVTGTVSYNNASNIATFTPASNLATNTPYTATITTGATDLAGNALASDFVWMFTTGTTTCTTPVPLGATATFAAGFGGGAGMTNQGIFTVINGDIGTTGASTTMTGFHDAGPGCTYTETPLNVGTVNGMIYTAPPPPTVACPSEGTAVTFAIATQAAADALIAFNTLAGLPGGSDPGAGQLGGLVLAPGTYTSAAGTFLITGSDLTLDAQGDANAVWVFQMAASLTVGAAGAPRSVILVNGAQAKNVFWQVGSAATINGAGGGTMVGTIVAQAGVSFSTAGNVAITTLNGRALVLTGPVTMVNTVINVPAP
jgi:hypothetical protein